MKEVDIYSNIEEAVKMVVANKVDLVRLASHCFQQMQHGFLGVWHSCVGSRLFACVCPTQCSRCRMPELTATLVRADCQSPAP
jgi:hypothetical protein